MKLNGEGIASPSCQDKFEKLIVDLSSLAGVPVCSRPSLNPAERREADRPMEGASFNLPAGKRFWPGCSMRIRKKGG